MTKNSGRGRPSPSPASKTSARNRKKPAAKSKLQKLQIAPRTTKKRSDRRGTPKGKGTTTTKGGGRIGNPPFVATAEQRIQVEAYVAAGAQGWLIAEYLGVSEDTLQRHFKVELDHGKQRVDVKVGSSIAKKALAGDPDMEKFYAARRAGWKSTTAVEASGPNGGPIEYRELSDEELDARIAKLTSHAAAVAKD